VRGIKLKAYELAKILDQISALLKSLPNEDIQNSLKLLQGLVDKSSLSKREPAKGRASYIALPDGVIDKLHSMTPSEAESFLDSDVAFVSTASILRLSEALGIGASKRQSRNAVVNSIIRHLEARKMSSIIRNDANIGNETLSSED